MNGQSRRQRRAQAVATRQELRRTVEKLGDESWTRVDGPVGFEYRHRSALGKEWVVRGIWPRVTVVIAAAAGLVGLLIGLFAPIAR